MEVGQERLRMSNLHKIFKNDKNSKSMKVGPGAIQGYTLGIFLRTFRIQEPTLCHKNLYYVALQ